MAKSKSKRSNQKNNSSSNSNDSGFRNLSQSASQGALICIDEQNSECTQSRLDERKMEVSLTQVDQWLNEVHDVSVPSETIEPSPKQTCEQVVTQTPEVEDVSPTLFQQFDSILENGQMPVNNKSLSNHSIDSLPGFDFRAVSQQMEVSLSLMESRLDQLLVTFESKMNRCCSEVLEAFDQTFASFETMPSGSAASSVVEKSKTDPQPLTESSWESRKRKMLSEFGMSTEEIEQIVPVGKTNGPAATATNNTLERAAPNPEKFEALHHSIETLDKIDYGIQSEEIDQLKEQLTAQLREAEVELSINRAKLSKEWAALEQKASELSQREAALKSKYTDVESTSKSGLLDRITRHLSRKK
jgi:hypothetical protein